MPWRQEIQGMLPVCGCIAKRETRGPGRIAFVWTCDLRDAGHLLDRYLCLLNIEHNEPW